MKLRVLTAVAFIGMLAACGKTQDAAPAAESASAAPADEMPTEIPMPEAPRFDTSDAPSGVYANDPGHSYVAFTYSHMGYSHPIVRWGKWSAEINWNSSEPEKSTVTATIDVASVDSGVERLDEHLRSADFFEAETYPSITFNSTALTLTGPDTGELTGDLTVKDVTKPVTFAVKINRAADDGFAKAYKLGFSATGQLKRSDYGVDLYVPMVSDDIEFTIEAEFIMPKEAVEQ